MIARYFVMVPAILVLASSVSAGDKKKNDRDRLQGEWTVVSMELSGRKRNPDQIKTMRPLLIKGNEWTAPVGTRRFTFKLDPTKSPKELDLQGEKNGKVNTWRGIYKLEADTFTFCRSHLAGGKRPKEFKGGPGVVLIQFKRSAK